MVRGGRFFENGADPLTQFFYQGAALFDLGAQRRMDRDLKDPDSQIHIKLSGLKAAIDRGRAFWGAKITPPGPSSPSDISSCLLSCR